MKIKHILSILTITILACSCNSDTEGPAVQATGTVSFAGLQISADDIQIAVSRAVDNDFRLFIAGNNDTLYYTKSKLPETLTLPVGKYILAGRTYTVEDEPLQDDKACFEGKVDFEIKENALTMVDAMNCRMVNLKVEVDIDSKVSNSYNDIKVVVSTFSNGGRKEFTGNGTGYFKIPYNTTDSLTAVFTGKIGENTITETRGYSGLKAGDFYKISYELTSLPTPPVD